MTRPVEPIAPPGALASFVVGQPVSGALLEGLAESLSFLCGRNLPQIVSASDLAPLATQETYFVYVRTRACRALAIAVELQGNAGGGRSTVGVSLHTGSGSVAWYPTLGTSESNGRLNGTSELPATNSTQRDYPVFEGILDVSGLTVGELCVLKVTSGDASSSGGRGIFSLSVWEVPQAHTDPVASPSEEIGVDPGWLTGENGIIDGSESSPRGIGRLFRECDRARSEVPRQWQVITPEGASWERSSGGGAGALNWGSRFTSFDHVWRVRARKLYADAGNRVKFFARYAWNGSGSGVLRCTASSTNTGGATTNTGDIVLQNTGGSAVYVVDWVEMELPTDGTAQEVELTFECDADDATCSVCVLGWVEHEVDAPAVLSEAVFWWEVDDLELTGSEIDQWNDKTGNGRHAVAYTTDKAVLSGGAAQFYFGSLKNIYSLAHESSLEPDSWSIFFVGSFPNSTLDWTLLKSSSDLYNGQSDGWGFREVFSGADHSFLTAYDTDCDTETLGAPRTVGAAATYYTDGIEFGEIASYLVVYDSVAETLTISDSVGNTEQITGVSLPRTASTADVLFGGSPDGDALGYDGKACLAAFFGKAVSDDEKERLFEYARAAHGAL